MRISSLSLACLLVGLAGPVFAQPHAAAPKPAPKVAPGPKKLGTFEDWTAATHQEGGATVCYAFTYPSNSVPKLPGRGEVVLTVTERPSGRDEVALTAGFAYAANAVVTLQVDQAGFDFYTAQRNAFARDGKAVIAALQKGSAAQARSPAPHDARVVDTFSLRGFTAAYAAINKACPAR